MLSIEANFITNKPPDAILSREFPDALLVKYVLETLKESNVAVKVDNKEDLPNYFRTAFDKLMPKDGFEGLQLLDRDKDISNLTEKAIEFVSKNKDKLVGLAFIELLVLAISTSSSQFLKDTGASSKTINKFLVFASQLNYLENQHKTILRKILDVYKPYTDLAKQTGCAVITEGPLKADICAEKLDRCFIATAGVSSFNSDFANYLLREIPELKSVAVAFDTDWDKKEPVRVAIIRLINTLEESGLNVKIWEWPSEFKGIDDFILAGGELA